MYFIHYAFYPLRILSDRELDESTSSALLASASSHEIITTTATTYERHCPLPCYYSH